MKNKIFGLTGNMGCGKSTIANLLAVHEDIYIFDCDSVAKEILADQKNFEKIRQILGDEVVINNQIDKQKVSQIIFNNPEKKQKLEGFIHPMVWEKLSEIINQSKEEMMFVVESAILFEIKWEERMNKVILVTCSKEEQFRRIKTRSGWNDEEIEKRLGKQIANEIKESKSWAVINTNCSLEELKEKTEKLYACMISGGEDKLIL